MCMRIFVRDRISAVCVVLCCAVQLCHHLCLVFSVLCILSCHSHLIKAWCEHGHELGGDLVVFDPGMKYETLKIGIYLV
jgi:hypothetical protein